MIPTAPDRHPAAQPDRETGRAATGRTGPAPGSLSRRSALAGLGGLTGVGLLTACGGSAPTVPDSVPDASAAASSAAQEAQEALLSAADIPVGGGRVFADQDVVVTQPSAGEYQAFSATCTHQGCKVRDVVDGEIICPCHDSAFAIADGSVLRGPAQQPLPEKSVSVEDGGIVVT